MLDRRVPPPDGWTLEGIERERAVYGERTEAYLRAASDCGLLGSPDSADLVSRLRDTDDANFRSGYSECLVAWYLSGCLGLKLRARPRGRAGRPLELAILDSRGPIHVEVKAPRREPVVYTLDEARVGAIRAHTVDDSDIVRERVDDARKQLDEATANVVVLASDLTLQEDFTLRSTLTTALYGALPIVLKRHAGGEQLVRECVPNGLFLRHRRTGKPPQFKRVSGVLCVEECRDYRAGPFDYVTYLVHNPCASKQLPRDIWGDIPQLELVGDALVWSDERDAKND